MNITNLTIWGGATIFINEWNQFSSMSGEVELDSSEFFEGTVEFSPKGEKPSWVRSAETTGARLLSRSSRSMVCATTKEGEDMKIESNAFVAEIIFEKSANTYTFSVMAK